LSADGSFAVCGRRSVLRHFIFLGGTGPAAARAATGKPPYVRERLRSYWANEESDSTRKSPTGDQQYQSLVAVGAGGAVGVGFGQGNQQRGWLPLAYNDFVGSGCG
jgi:cell division protein FtsW